MNSKQLLPLLNDISAALERARTAQTPDAQVELAKQVFDGVARLHEQLGVDALLTERAMREGQEACAELKTQVTLEDIEKARIEDGLGGRIYTRAALARHLLDLPVGFAKTKATQAAIKSLLDLNAGMDAWLCDPEPRQGVKKDGSVRDTFYLTVVARAAEIEVKLETTTRAALITAAAEFGPIAAVLKLPLDPESLRRRLSPLPAHQTRGKEDRLAVYHRNMLRMFRKEVKQRAERPQ